MRKIIHVDMDAFYASVEQRDEPSFRGKPLVVGGLPSERGVVAAASYEARQFGIYSAMPSSLARQKCPQLIFVRPRFDIYKSISAEIHEIFHDYTDLVEPLSLDEAYLDVTDNKKAVQSATLLAQEIRKRIKVKTGLTASAGVSVNKFLAKTASAMKKPDGLFLIPPDQVESFIQDLPIEKFYGIGKVTAEKMHKLGVITGADLRTWTQADLLKHFGKSGSFYFNIVRGRDDRQVEANRIRRSIGSEESYAQDLIDQASIDHALLEIVHSLTKRIERANTGGRTITLKVKYADYEQITRSRTLNHSVSQADIIYLIAGELLAATDCLSRKVRLLGVTLSNLDSEEEQAEHVQLRLSFAS